MMRVMDSVGSSRAPFSTVTLRVEGGTGIRKRSADVPISATRGWLPRRLVWTSGRRCHNSPRESLLQQSDPDAEQSENRERR